MSAAHITIDRDLSGAWIAHGTAAGVPFVAEGVTESDALTEALALVFQSHATRRMRAIAARRTPAQEADPCLI